MSLLPHHKSFGHRHEALIHFNEALDRQAAGHSSVAVALALFDGLNKLQTEWAVLNPTAERSETKLFGLMFQDLLKGDVRSDLVKSDELRSLAELQPLVMDHQDLNRSRDVPGESVEPKTHNELLNAFSEYQLDASPESQAQVVRWTAELLYVVRSNIAHGEKTAYGPDVSKRARDEQVCACVVPLQLLLFDLFLQRPSRKLLVYGTLAPGEANHGVISVLGEWKPCQVHGTITRQNGLPYLSWNPSGGELPAQLFASSELPNAWKRLDDFEGEEYKRRLVSLETDTELAVAYAYLDARP